MRGKLAIIFLRSAEIEVTNNSCSNDCGSFFRALVFYEYCFKSVLFIIPKCAVRHIIYFVTFIITIERWV